MLLSLPIELLYQVMYYLSDRDLQSLAKSQRRCYIIYNDKHFWAEKIIFDFGIGIDSIKDRINESTFQTYQRIKSGLIMANKYPAWYDFNDAFVNYVLHRHRVAAEHLLSINRHINIDIVSSMLVKNFEISILYFMDLFRVYAGELDLLSYKISTHSDIESLSSIDIGFFLGNVDDLLSRWHYKLNRLRQGDEISLHEKQNCIRIVLTRYLQTRRIINDTNQYLKNVKCVYPFSYRDVFEGFDIENEFRLKWD